MSKVSDAQETLRARPRAIEQLREAAKLLTGRVARAYCGRSWGKLRQVLLTQASKTPHRAYLDTALLVAAAPEIARLTQELDTGLLRYEAAPDEGQLARMEPLVAHLAVYLIRIYRLGGLPSVRAGRERAPSQTGIPREHWESAMRQRLAQDMALRSELSDLGMVLLRVLAAQGNEAEPRTDLLKDHAQAGATHKLKFKIPLIPLFLDYEGEIEVGGKFDLGRLWSRVRAWLRGETA